LFAGDLGNVIEATSTGGRWSDFFTARKLAPGNLGLLQQHQPFASLMPIAVRAGFRAMADSGHPGTVGAWCRWQVPTRRCHRGSGRSPTIPQQKTRCRENGPTGTKTTA